MNPYLRIGDRAYWSNASVERGLRAIRKFATARGLDGQSFVDAFTAELMADDPGDDNESDLAIKHAFDLWEQSFLKKQRAANEQSAKVIGGEQ